MTTQRYLWGTLSTVDGPYPNSITITFKPHWWAFWKRSGTIISTKTPVRYASFHGIADIRPEASDHHSPTG